MKKQFNFASTLMRISCFTVVLMWLSAVSSCTNQRGGDMPDHEKMTTETSTGFVTAEEAEAIALRFINADESMRATSGELTLVYQEPTDSIALRSAYTYPHQDKPSYYVFNTGDQKGFVIVSANDLTYPILGYSSEGAFPEAGKLPLGIQNLLADYAHEIQYLWAESDDLSPETRSEINQLRTLSIDNGIATEESTRAASSVAPLMIGIHWDQSPYYNDFCPEGTPVGCVATALCQIMRYWEYPDRGTGTHRSTKFYWQIADYNHPLNWDNMPKGLLNEPNDDVAQFCYDVAVGLNMNFQPGNSGTFHRYVMPLIIDHYYYDEGARQVFRDYVGTAEWVRLIKEELSANRPVQLGGSGRGGGHSFVCDGYSNRGYFHINWGWGGVSDGYFLIDRLNPIDLGTGGGAGGGFNYGQDMVIGIQPPAEEEQPDPEIDNDDVADYCYSSARNARSTYIQSVSISNMTNVTNVTKSGEGGYNYYPYKEVKLEPGKSYQLTVKPGALYGSYREYWNVWIDYDGNKIFSSDERVLGFQTYSTREVSYTFTVPYDAKGDTRMRISMKWNAAAEPCETFEYGEVEDYPVSFERTGDLPEPKPTPVVPTPEPSPEPSPITYPVSKAKSAELAYISGVKIGFTENLNKVGNLYQDYTNFEFTARSGSSINYKFSPAYPTGRTYWSYWRAWVDFDQNGRFDDSERLINRYDYRNLEGWLSIPRSVASGSYRMRVSMKLYSYPTADEVFDYGEVEDYTLVIK